MAVSENNDIVENWFEKENMEIKHQQYAYRFHIDIFAKKL